MTTDEVRIRELEAKFDQRQRLVLVRTFLLSAVPVVMAGLLLWWTLLEIDDARTKVQSVKNELVQAQQKLSETEERLISTEAKLKRTQEDLEEALRKSATYQENLYDMNWRELKSIASNSKTFEILIKIDKLRRQNVGWAPRGFAPNEGFNSPSFAAFVLQEIDSSLRGPSAYAVLQGLRTVPIGAQEPGDIVVYEAGYHMFYFQDHGGTEFVIGMTPEGIAALKLHFGPKIEKVLRIELR